MAAVLDNCLTWVNDRIQFGKPIARFQAIQHLMAELAAETAAASAAADLGVEASVDQPDRFNEVLLDWLRQTGDPLARDLRSREDP